MRVVSVKGAVVLSCLLTMGACSSPQRSTAAPPTVVCGTTLSTSPAGATIDDATIDPPVITRTTVGSGYAGLGPVFLRVATGCDHGVTLSITLRERPRSRRRPTPGTGFRPPSSWTS